MACRRRQQSERKALRLKGARKRSRAAKCGWSLVELRRYRKMPARTASACSSGPKSGPPLHPSRKREGQGWVLRRRWVGRAARGFVGPVVGLVVGVGRADAVVDAAGSRDLDQPPARVIAVGNGFACRGCSRARKRRRCTRDSDESPHGPLNSWRPAARGRRGKRSLHRAAGTGTELGQAFRHLSNKMMRLCILLENSYKISALQ